MNTYVISSLKRTEPEAARLLSHDLNFEKLFSTVPSTIYFDVKFNEEENYIFIFSKEEVGMKFTYFNEKRFYDLHTVNILNLDTMRIMLSFVQGIGILGRGGPLNYISSEIGPLIGSSLFDSSTMFEVRKFSDEEMQWQTWNGKLLGITFEPPDIEFISMGGEEVESKIRDLKMYPNDNYKIKSIKVKNENFSRRINVERNGKVKITLWPGKIGMHQFEEEAPFSTFSRKMIEFFEYIEGVLGVSP